MTSHFSFASIGAQIAASVGVVLVGLLVVIAVGIMGLHEVERNISELVNVGTVKSDTASQMHLSVVERVDTVRNIALKSEVNAMQADIQRVDALVKHYLLLRDRLTRLGLSSQEQSAISRADTASERAAPFLKQSLFFARTMQPEMAAEVLTSKLAPIQEQWVAALKDLAAATESARAAALAAAQGSRQRTFIWMCVAGALALIGGTSLAVMITRRICQRLHTAMMITRHIAEGDLTSDVRITGDDEVAQTLAALCTMQIKLQSIIGEVREAALVIETASAEVASGSHDLSLKIETSANHLQHTAGDMDSLTNSVKKSTESAVFACDLATQAAEIAERGGAVVSQVVTTMQDINAASAKIGDIIGVIDGIAFQTNILALNAAVEAARAGEQGRGFAVVASEVRVLAARSAQAAKEIKELVNASLTKVDNGSLMVKQAGSTMKEILVSVRRVCEVIVEISHTAKEQTQGIDRISHAVNQIDQMTQEDAALVEQSAASAKSMRDQTERLIRAVSTFRFSHRTAETIQRQAN